MAVNVVFLVLQMLNRRPWSPLCWGLAFFTASYQHFLRSPNSIGVPEGPLDRVWFYLPYLVLLLLQLAGTRIQLSYIIVRHSLDRPLDLWNRMFDRHQVKITVMQFRGHSLPVRQSMRVSWDFFSLSHFVSQFPPTRFPLLTAIGMYHFLPVHHLEWHFGPGWRPKYNSMSHSS